MRSTIHAVCCGTNLTIVLAGKLERWKYVLGGPPTVDEERNMLSPGDGSAWRGVVERAAFCVVCVAGYRELWMAAIERRDSAGRAAQMEFIVASRAGVARDIV